MKNELTLLIHTIFSLFLQIFIISLLFFISKTIKEKTNLFNSKNSHNDKISTTNMLIFSSNIKIVVVINNYYNQSKIIFNIPKKNH